MDLHTCVCCSDSTDHAADGTELAPGRWCCANCRDNRMSAYEFGMLRARYIELHTNDLISGKIDQTRKDLRDALRDPADDWKFGDSGDD